MVILDYFRIRLKRGDVQVIIEREQREKLGKEKKKGRERKERRKKKGKIGKRKSERKLRIID